MIQSMMPASKIANKLANGRGEIGKGNASKSDNHSIRKICKFSEVNRSLGIRVFSVDNSRVVARSAAFAPDRCLIAELGDDRLLGT
jgi:hypothetical protein